MASKLRTPVSLSKRDARRIWLQAQRLDVPDAFGSGSGAAHAATRHLGYVQIDTINVIERCHHHILWSRISDYRRDHLHEAQSVDKAVFEYWTHALAYVAVEDMPYFLPEMKRHRANPTGWSTDVSATDVRKMIKRIRDDGPLTIRDIDDDVLVDKEHAWGSRKPSRRALRRAFYDGDLVVSVRSGMLKTYELTTRHFGWDRPPKPATERQVHAYLLARALRAQGAVSLDSICHLNAKLKPAIRAVIETRVKRKELIAVAIEGAGRAEHWAEPASLDGLDRRETGSVHLLSPFDPLIIQRQRLKLFFDYEHRFEAYVPKHKRLFGYFALPVLVDDEVVAAIDLKTDRAARKLLIQQWTWVGRGSEILKARIEDELHRFERFQLQAVEHPSQIHGELDLDRTAAPASRASDERPS